MKGSLTISNLSWLFFPLNQARPFFPSFISSFWGKLPSKVIGDPAHLISLSFLLSWEFNKTDNLLRFFRCDKRKSTRTKFTRKLVSLCFVVFLPKRKGPLDKKITQSTKKPATQLFQSLVRLLNLKKEDQKIERKETQGHLARSSIALRKYATLLGEK